jgi:hypothetical protein
MTQTIKGFLVIDSARGVIYFHSAETGVTIFRIGRLPAPIPLNETLDVSHMHGTNWDEAARTSAVNAFVQSRMPEDARGDEYEEI